MLNCVLIAMRFWMVPGSFYHSFIDQVESLFIPAVVSSPGPPNLVATGSLTDYSRWYRLAPFSSTYVNTVSLIPVYGSYM